MAALDECVEEGGGESDDELPDEYLYHLLEYLCHQPGLLGHKRTRVLNHLSLSPCIQAHTDHLMRILQITASQYQVIYRNWHDYLAIIIDNIA